MTSRTEALFSTGRWIGTYGVLSLDERVVTRLLDPRLELGSQWLAPAGHHPVYFMLGRQEDVRGTWPVFRSFAVAYDEATILVPHVRFRNGERDFLYMPRLYLDSSWPTFLGRYAFGFDKIRKDIVRRAGHYAVRESSGENLWRAAIEPIAGGSTSDTAGAYAKLAGIFAQPFIGFRSVLGRGAELASWMTFTNHVCTPVKMELTVDDPHLTGKGIQGAYCFGGLDSAVVGTAVHLESDWTLSFPQPANRG